MKKDKKQALADIWAGLHCVKTEASRADELIACLEGEIAKRDETIARLEPQLNRAIQANYDLREELAACRIAVENCEVFRVRVAELEDDLKCAHSMLGEVSKKGMDLRAELAVLAKKYTWALAELAAMKAQEPVAWTLKNEKGRIEEILPYMPCASDMQLYWPEPTPLYAAPVAKQVVMPEREWLQSDDLIYSLENDVNYYEINVTQVEGNRHDGKRAEFASKLIELLNAADHAEGAERKWMPIAELLPEIDELCLIRIPFCGRYEVEGAKYKGDGVWLAAWCGVKGRNCTYKVSHWMPADDILWKRSAEKGGQDE